MDHGPDRPSLGTLVRQRRLALGLSQEDLAARVSDDRDAVRQSDISRLELGKVGLPRRARLLRLAAALDLAPGDLLARSGWARVDPAPSVPTATIDPTRRDVIVVADDEPIVAEALAAALAAEGYAVPIAHGLTDLSSVLAAEHPTLVIADAAWPVAALAELQQRLDALAPPVPLLLVGDPPPASALAGLPVLARPFVLAALRAAIAGVLEGGLDQPEELPEVERLGQEDGSRIAEGGADPSRAHQERR
jgi:transcriptional regulator with XRE-family HTH domain